MASSVGDPRERVARRARARRARRSRRRWAGAPSSLETRGSSRRCRRRPTTTELVATDGVVHYGTPPRNVAADGLGARASTLNASQHEFYLAGPRPDHPREIVEGDTVLVSYRRDGAHFAGLEIGGVRFVPPPALADTLECRERLDVTAEVAMGGGDGLGDGMAVVVGDVSNASALLALGEIGAPPLARGLMLRLRRVPWTVDGMLPAAELYLDGASLWNASSEWADRYMEEHEWLRLRIILAANRTLVLSIGDEVRTMARLPSDAASPPAARRAAPPSSRPRSRAATSIASAPSVGAAARRPTRRCRLMSPPTAGTSPPRHRGRRRRRHRRRRRSDVRQPDAAPHQLFVLRAGDALVGVAGGGARRRRRAPPRARRRRRPRHVALLRLQLVVARRVGGGDVERGGGRRRVPRAEQLGGERDGRAPPLAQRPAADGRRARLPVRQPAHLVVRAERGAGGGRHRLAIAGTELETRVASLNTGTTVASDFGGEQSTATWDAFSQKLKCASPRAEARGGALPLHVSLNGQEMSADDPVVLEGTRASPAPPSARRRRRRRWRRPTRRA